VFESSLSERKSSLANSYFYLLVTDLLTYLQRATSDDSHTDSDRVAAAKYVYDRLTSEISQSIMGKLETGDDLVVSRLGTLLLCLSGQFNVEAHVHNVQKTVRFVADEAASSQAETSSAAVTDDDESFTTKIEKTRGVSTGADLMGDEQSPLWHLMCQSCRLSLHFVHSESSCRHLRLLSVVLSANTTDRLLTELLTQSELSSASELSACRDFLERMLLPLADKFHDNEGSRHVLSLLMSVYGRLQPAEQVPVLKEIVDRAAWNVICADISRDNTCREPSLS